MKKESRPHRFSQKRFEESKSNVKKPALIDNVNSCCAVREGRLTRERKKIDFNNINLSNSSANLKCTKSPITFFAVTVLCTWKQRESELKSFCVRREINQMFSKLKVD